MQKKKNLQVLCQNSVFQFMKESPKYIYIYLYLYTHVWRLFTQHTYIHMIPIWKVLKIWEICTCIWLILKQNTISIIQFEKHYEYAL